MKQTNKKPKYEAQERYIKKFLKPMAIRFNVKTDGDIIEKLETCGNKSKYIKDLIRDDLAKNQ